MITVQPLFDIDVSKFPKVSKEEWLSMTFPRGCSKTHLWFDAWINYGIENGWLTREKVIKAMEAIVGDEES